MDINSADFCVSATVQRLTVYFVFKFVNRVMVSGYVIDGDSNIFITTYIHLKDCVNVLMDEINSAKSTHGLSEETTPSKAVSNEFVHI